MLPGLQHVRMMSPPPSGPLTTPGPSTSTSRLMLWTYHLQA